jgi:hypothetical protein
MEIDLGLELISLTKIDNIEPYSSFKIIGFGDLTMMNGTKKKGFGCMVRHESIRKIQGYYKPITQEFFFTEKEVKESFVEMSVYYDKIYQRDLKIDTILND